MLHRINPLGSKDNSENSTGDPFGWRCNTHPDSSRNASSNRLPWVSEMRAYWLSGNVSANLYAASTALFALWKMR